MNYQGVAKNTMHKSFRGECIYQAEVDVHFPQMTVGQTFDFAARARVSWPEYLICVRTKRDQAPRNLLSIISPEAYASHLRDVALRVFGLSHTVDTMVGNDLIRGVSGGERKRVSIAEAAMSGSPLQCWDNSTRGLDSATALEFMRTMRTSTELTGAAAMVSLYQASQSIYDVFDKVALLYEGRQIYFGDIHAAKAFFEHLGFDSLPRQTTADFLTSLTNPSQRVIRKGFEGKTPHSPDDFAAVWRKSGDRVLLLRNIENFDRQYPIGGPSLYQFLRSRKAVQAKSQQVKISASRWSSIDTRQARKVTIQLCVHRGYQRLRGDMALLITGIIFNSVMALVIGSVFYDLPNNTDALFSRGALIFFAILLAAFASALEILTLYAQRPIVEKQSKYAFYHPFAEGFGGST
ncbi:MAG: hypothetical protein Q9168_002291 [Polycauliona sp. 1 TL-2023]